MSVTIDFRSNYCLQYFTFGFITFLLKFTFEVKLFVVEKIVVVKKVSQIVLFIWTQLFRILHIYTIMHAYTIDYYCCCYQYFTLCALHIISYIFLLIRPCIFRNSDVGVVICPEQIKFPYDLTYYIFLMQSHSYFITHINFLFSILSHSYYNFYFEVTLFIVEKS